MARFKKLVGRVRKSNKSTVRSKKHRLPNDSQALKSIKKQNVRAIESEILDLNDLIGNVDVPEDITPAEVIDLGKEIESDEPAIEEPKGKKPSGHNRDMLEQIMFRLPCVDEPLIGTPKQVRKELDALAKKMQKYPKDNSIFNKIHLYMHGYLINVVLKKFPFIRGLQTADVYQETLIALRFKAIPNFKCGKGMSFLNFAKMCIRRHLITLLNISKNRKKDLSINQAISLDSSPAREDEDDSKTTYANIIADTKVPADKTIEINEAYEVTKTALLNALSDFEKIVLSEYLSNSSYKEISANITENLKKRSNTKSIDNALLRIRKKAIHLMKHSRKEELPIFLPKKSSGHV